MITFNKFKTKIDESKVVKSVKIGDFDHQLQDHGYGYQVRIYNNGELVHSDITKNTLQKGMSSLEDNISYTKKQLNIKD